MLIHSAEGGTLHPVRRLFLGAESGCHQVVFHGRWLLVPCLKRNRVFLFDRAQDFAPAGELAFPQGTGPRHGLFSADHRRFYLVSETSNALFTYASDGPNFTLEGVVPILPRSFRGKAETAAIRMSEDGTTLYVSVRGANLITVFRLGSGLPQCVQHADALGLDPWDILPVPHAPLLLTANRKSGALVCRALEADGDFITMDFGCVLHGYCSDMTRTVAIGHVTEEMDKVYHTVLEAQLAGIAQARAKKPLDSIKY